MPRKNLGFPPPPPRKNLEGGLKNPPTPLGFGPDREGKGRGRERGGEEGRRGKEGERRGKEKERRRGKEGKREGERRKGEGKEKGGRGRRGERRRGGRGGEEKRGGRERKRGEEGGERREGERGRGGQTASKSMEEKKPSNWAHTRVRTSSALGNLVIMTAGPDNDCSRHETHMWLFEACLRGEERTGDSKRKETRVATHLGNHAAVKEGWRLSGLFLSRERGRREGEGRETDHDTERMADIRVKTEGRATDRVLEAEF
ncbi:unnamed protein product [Pleuronectes platessa]|uniref:Uncharacterized protein n=1 Tax=Pleuronectes platessa TaxID=8262 RepID=A0A9N7UNN3_PLEPL|nr:unnamed protein product [Pleuronectes platessa]